MEAFGKSNLRIGLLFFLIWYAPVCGDETALETDSISKDYTAELPRSEPTEPNESLEKFRLMRGFRVELVASEPLVADPIAMAFDERGRMYVVCMRGYSEHRDDHLGVVRRLEDTNNDGVYDRGTDYAKGLAWPTAIACYDGGIIVAAPPDLLYLKDIDGDGLADQREVWFSGFGHQNVQGMLNSFRWGLNNRLYGAAGLNGGRISQPGGESDAVSLRGRDFSIDVDRRQLHPESGGAQHGATFDTWGERYVSSNSDHVQWIEFQDRHLRRNPLLNGVRSRRSIAVEGPAAEVYRTSAVEPWRIVRTRLRVKGLVTGRWRGEGVPRDILRVRVGSLHTRVMLFRHPTRLRPSSSWATSAATWCT